MPFGFMDDLKRLNLSPVTQDSYQVRIENFIAFLNERYKTQISPYQIAAKDIRDYLSDRRSLGIKDSTLQKDFGVIKHFFDYLWRTDQIPVDFVAKMKFDFHITNKKRFPYSYEELLEIYPLVCCHTRLKSRIKVLFILCMKGFRLKEIRFLSINNIKDCQDSIIISVQRRNYGEFAVSLTERMEMDAIRDCLQEAEERGTIYLISSKNHAEDSYEELKQSSVAQLWTTLSNAVGLSNISNTGIRFAYVYHLYNVEKKPVEEIAKIIGTSLPTTIDLLQEATNRIEE